MKACLTFLCLSPVALACQVDDGAQVGHSNQEILGGTPISPGQFPTVVALAVDGGGRGLCTGTLVGPDLVLTAAHCVNPGLTGYSTQAEVTANTIIITDSSTLGQNGTVHTVVETLGDPGFGQPGDPDVGIVRLAQPITDRAPSRVNFEAAKAPVGVTVTMVGYGIADDGQAGRGFVLNSKVSQSCSGSATNDMFLCFNQTDGTGKCSGDSGGPSFAMINGAQTVVGITSFGDRDCQVLGADMRTDASKTFLAANAPDLLCGADGTCATGCGSGGLPIDPDCGAACASDGDCGDGLSCNTNAGMCFAGPDSPGGLGAACGDGLAACNSGICATKDGDQVCTETCSPAADTCPSDFECFDTGNGAGACFKETSGGICSAGGRGNGPAAVIILLALVALRTRRRKT